MIKQTRRDFVNMMAVAAAGTVVAPLGLFHARRAHAGVAGCLANGVSAGFGPLSPKLPLNSLDLIDTVIDDLSTTPLLELPDGFVYTAVSITGSQMSDGALVPGDHDGMACFQGRRGTYILVRNHELSPGENEYGSREGCLPPNGKVYDPFNLPIGQGGGGTTTLVMDRNGRVIRDYISLGGTIRNCAGGPTPWGSWISCEENTSTPANDAAATRKHGYNFEVPSLLGEAVDPISLIDMGRFNHEAVAVDPSTGDVFQTEDRGDSAFYRFVPYARPNGFGDLQRGGSLYAMVIDPHVSARCDGTTIPVTAGGNVDTRSGVRSFLGQPLPVSWVPIDDVDPEEDIVRQEAQSKGAALFERGEGAWYGNGLVYFVCTSGGDNDSGQVWAYDPRRETVTLVVESDSEGALDNPDNITVARDGALYMCEDGGGEQFIVGVDGSGDMFKFARNNLDDSEFAGACFSPNGEFMYVNSQGLGVTYAIWREDQRPIYVKAGFNKNGD